MKYIKKHENNNILYRIGDIVRLNRPLPHNMIDKDKPILTTNTDYIVKRVYKYNTKSNINFDVDEIYIDFDEVNNYNNMKTLVDVVDLNTGKLIEGCWSTRFYSVLRYNINKYNL